MQGGRDDVRILTGRRNSGGKSHMSHVCTVTNVYVCTFLSISVYSHGRVQMCIYVYACMPAEIICIPGCRSVDILIMCLSIYCMCSFLHICINLNVRRDAYMFVYVYTSVFMLGFLHMSLVLCT